MPLTSFVLRVAVVAKLLILGILVLTSLILGFRVVLVAKLVVSGISSLIIFILALYTSFLTTSFFSTTFSLLKSTGADTNLSIFNLSASGFKLGKSTFFEKFDVSTPVTFFKSVFIE